MSELDQDFFINANNAFLQRHREIFEPYVDESEGVDFADNIKLAKKYMVESIYRSANIEGIGVTFPETQTICDGMSVGGHSIDDIEAIIDLKNAWKWYFGNPGILINSKTLKTVNSILGKNTVINSGCFRTLYDEPIRVPLKNNENYYPPIPNEKEIEADIKAFLGLDDKLEASLELFCYVAKGQFFNDGNKRTATLFANICMIQNNQGIFSIPVDKKLDFYNLLADYYKDDINKGNLIEFLKNNCITRLTVPHD